MREASGRMELNVFGGNDVARSLYRSLGYVERAVSMGKDIDVPPAQANAPSVPAQKTNEPLNPDI